MEADAADSKYVDETDYGGYEAGSSDQLAFSTQEVAESAKAARQTAVAGYVIFQIPWELQSLILLKR